MTWIQFLLLFVTINLVLWVGYRQVSSKVSNYFRPSPPREGPAEKCIARSWRKPKKNLSLDRSPPVVTERKVEASTKSTSRLARFGLGLVDTVRSVSAKLLSNDTLKYGAINSFVIPWIIRQCRTRNPSLTLDQEWSLGQMLSRSVESWRAGKPIGALIRPVLAIAVPCAHSDLLVDIVDMFSNFGTNEYSGKKPSFDTTTVPNDHTKLLDDIQLKQLDDQLQRVGVRDISRFNAIGGSAYHIQTAKEALLRTVTSGSQPQCPITLEDILNPTNGTLEPNVAMIVQLGEPTTSSKTFVYLYKKTALDVWFGQSTTNPVTRMTTSRQNVVVLT